MHTAQCTLHTARFTLHTTHGTLLLSGGELFSYLRSAGRFNSATTFFYSAEIVSALDYLHSLSVVYR